jgi:hypothetical protein
MILLQTRRAVIEWAGRVHAFPVKAGETVDLAVPGPDAVGTRRIGWEAFFDGLEGRHLVVAVDGPDGFEHRILGKSKAHAELPAEAFGPPWYRRLWHEVTLR